jgi:hypothetical protein
MPQIVNPFKTGSPAFKLASWGVAGVAMYAYYQYRRQNPSVMSDQEVNSFNKERKSKLRKKSSNKDKME